MKTLLALLGATLSLCVFAQAAAQNASSTPPQAMIDLRNDCLRQFEQPQFALLHARVPYLTHSTLSMIVTNVKPSPQERAALRTFLPIAIECEKTGMALVEPAQAPITYLYQLAGNVRIGGLALLTTGQITFADYAMMSDMVHDHVVASDKAAADQKAMEQQQATQQQQAAREQALIALSCVVHMDSSEPIVQNLNGTEFQFSIDSVHGTATASRGPAPPTEVSVSPTLITFHQGDIYVSISRATGRFSETAKEGMVIFSGTCEPIRGAKF